MVDEKFWKGKKVFITGSTGLVGSWITKSLVDMGAEVTALVRDMTPGSHFARFKLGDQVNVVYGRLEDYSTVERGINEYEVEIVFHLGAQAIVGIANRAPLSTFESNIKGSWNVLEACRNINTVKALVVASSDKAYGTHDKLPYTEDFPLRGLHPYDVSKTCTDLLCQTYHNTYGVPVVISRCGNIYGGGDVNFNRIIPDTCRSIIRGQNPQIRSDGTFIRDYIYIKDAVDAYLTLAKRMYEDKSIAGEAFNFGTGSPISVLDLVNLILEVSGKSKKLVPDILNTAKAEIKEQHLSSAKAKKVLGWQHRYMLKDGLKETYDWYAAFLAKN